MAGNINFHPAKGLGDLLPGWFAVPQNPITGIPDTSGASGPVTKTPGIGEIIDGYYVVPQNPIIDRVTGNVQPLGVSGDCGCGCGGGGGKCGGKTGMINGQRVGMGDLTSIQSEISAGNISAALQDTIGGIPVWVLIAAAIAVPMLMPGSGVGVSRRR